MQFLSIQSSFGRQSLPGFLFYPVMQNHSVIAFAGVGNMAQAMIQGLLKSGHPPDHILAHRRNLKAIRHLHEQGVQLCPTLPEAITPAQLVVLAVKPWHTLDLAQQCAAHLGTQAHLASVAAGISIAQLGEAVPDLAQHGRLVRLMPNTPVATGKGVIGCYAPNGENLLVTTALQPLGQLLWLKEEEQIHALTAIAGCGPAYYFRILEHMQTIAEELGLPAPEARQLVLHTLRGSSSLALDNQDKSFAALVEQIISPGSATGMALQTFAEQGLEACLRAGIQAAHKRSHQLSNFNPYSQ